MMHHESEQASPGAAAVARPLRILQVFAVVLLWNTAYKGVRVVSTLYALDLGAKPFDTGLLLSTYGLFPLLFAVYSGRIADRYGVRGPIACGLAGSACGAVLPFFWPTFAGLIVGAALTGIGFIFVQVPMQTLSGMLGEPGQRTRNINAYSLVVSAADLCGPVIAGFAIDHAGPVNAYIVMGVISVASLAGLGLIYARLPAKPAAAGPARRRMGDLFSNPDLRRTLLASAVVMAGLDLFQLYMPLYGHAVALSASAIGLAMGAYAAAGFVTRALIPLLIRRHSEQTIMLYSLFLAAAAFATVPLTTNGTVLGIICFVLGLGMGLGQPLSMILTYNYSPPGRAGEGLGLRIAINNGLHVVAPFAFGALGSLLGLNPVFWMTAAFLAVGARATIKQQAVS